MVSKETREKLLAIADLIMDRVNRPEVDSVTVLEQVKQLAELALSEIAK